ncbi:MAG: putative sulfate exporter family transporter [Clostridiales bacterium]|nr:putative sulfate exporter family transporter [Clostridiales bacterium]
MGFGLNLNVILETGVQSLPIYYSKYNSHISYSCFCIEQGFFKIPGKISTLVSVGSSICGGSAIAATVPVINADDDEVAQSISVIFFFNVLAALIFPHLGTFLGFATDSGEAFGIFAGTAANDTSSVTATSQLGIICGVSVLKRLIRR